MTAAEAISTILTLVFLGLLGYGLYLLQQNATLTRIQQNDINRALIDSITRSQRSNELSADAMQKLADIVYMMHAELSALSVTTHVPTANATPGNPVTTTIEVSVSKPVEESAVVPKEEPEEKAGEGEGAH